MAELFKSPKIAKPTPIPDQDSPAALEARRRKLEERSAEGGRESTSRVPSMGDYVGTKLGSGT